MEEKNFELTPNEMEEASGGNFDWITPEDKEKIRKVIIRAKQDGATLEDFLRAHRKAKGRDLYEYYKVVWDIVKVD